ncbi:hypothetical protein BDV29DRAFT_54060 [Aspergillus leporis]|uniref:Uncharacterized protein n=1 Tax=Aspergillus leporis TaxID=41062 RepID=A0A5N5XFG8_9EURO|nr:hypothetical protein BDV29DRAFT_54060 [Aspergillus leporis]
MPSCSIFGQLRTVVPTKISVNPEGFTQHYPQLAIAENRCRFSALVMKSPRLFDKKPRMMVPLAIFFPQACVAGRRKPESRGRNADRPRKIVDSLLVRHLCHWIRFTEDEIPTVLLVRYLRHWICFTEGVISSSSWQLERIRGGVHMISANATLQPVTAERLGEWGGGKAYSASELLKVAVSASCGVEGRPWNYSSQVNMVCYKLRIIRQCTFFSLRDMNGFTGSKKGGDVISLTS